MTKRKPFGTSQGNRPIVKRSSSMSASMHSISSSKRSSSGRPPLPSRTPSRKKKGGTDAIADKENIPTVVTDGIDHSSKTPRMRNAGKMKKITADTRNNETDASYRSSLILKDNFDQNKDQPRKSTSNTAVEYLLKDRALKQSLGSSTHKSLPSLQHTEPTQKNDSSYEKKTSKKESESELSEDLLLRPPQKFKKKSSVVMDDGYEPDDTDCDTIQADNAIQHNVNENMEINSFIRGNNSRMIDEDGRPHVTKGMMKRARISQVDNKGIITAMLESCTDKNSRISAKTPSTLSSIVGVTVGGKNLQRSDSLDASEVTMQTMETVYERGTGDEKNLTKSRRRRWRRHLSQTQTTSRLEEKSYRSSRDPPQDRYSMGDAEHCFSSGRQSQSQQSKSTRVSKREQEFVPKLPSGWTTHMSRSKGRLYYCHPDFGSTWHCPVVVPENDFETDAGTMLDPIKEDSENIHSDSSDASEERSQEYDDNVSDNGSVTSATNREHHSKKYATSHLQNSTSGTGSINPGSNTGDEDSIQSNLYKEDVSITKDMELESTQNEELVNTMSFRQDKCENHARNIVKMIETGNEESMLQYEDTSDSTEPKKMRLSVSVDANHETPSQENNSRQKRKKCRAHERSKNSGSKISTDKVVASDLTNNRSISRSESGNDRDHCYVEEETELPFSDNDFHGGFDTHEDDERDDSPGLNEKDQSEKSVDEVAQNQRTIHIKDQKKTCIKRKFPPHPTCSLQFIDLIEEGSLDTPSWRRCKRKPQRKVLRKTRMAMLGRRRKRARVLR